MVLGDHANVRVWRGMQLLIEFDEKIGSVPNRFGNQVRGEQIFKGSGGRDAHAACGDWANLGRRGAPSLRCFGGGV